MDSDSVIGVIAWPIQKRRKRWPGRCGVGDNSRRVVAALGTTLAGGGVCATGEAGVTRRLQALVGSATGGGDDVERARAGGGRANGKGGDLGFEPRSAS